MIEKISTELIDKLRDCQINSVKVIGNYLNSDSTKSCLISLPTGAGKSGVICTVSHYSKDDKILVVTHRRAVCDQLYEELSGSFFEKLLPQEPNYKNYLKKNIFNKINDISQDGIYCTTFQKINSLSEDELINIKNNFSLILIDEGHVEPSPKWSEVIRKLNKKKIIITATPYRNDLYSFDIDANYSYIYTFKSASGNNEIVYPVFKITNKSKLIHEIKKIIKKQPNSICIVKCKNFSEIERYYDDFSSHFKTIAIHDQYDNKKKNKINFVPKKLLDLKYEVFLHQKKLDEGIDIPEAKILVLTYSVGSGKELVQTTGRIVRKYETYKSTILDISGDNNKKLWKSYIEFDEYLSNEKSVEKFLRTLDTKKFIENYLKEFPEKSYFESNFRRKFDFNNFNPKESLEIPVASVCFYNKENEFDINVCLNKLESEFNREGALAKSYKELGVIVAIFFNNSKYLKDSLFFEPTLEIFIIRELQDMIAIFDSRSHKYSNRKDLKILSTIGVEKLFTVISGTEKIVTKRANTRALQNNLSRPESISIKGKNLELINHEQSNSGYAITTTVVSNVGDNGKPISTYYLGVASGRISDQKKLGISYEEFINWIDSINSCLQSNGENESNFINSFSQSINYTPVENPVACVFDFTDEKYVDLGVEYKGVKESIDNSYIYKSYSDGVSFFEFSDGSSSDEMVGKFIKFSFDENLDLIIDYDKDLIFFNNGSKVEISEILNNESVKLLYSDSTVYLEGNFYKQKLPTETGRFNQNIVRNIISLDCLKQPNLSEKDEDNILNDNFSENSVFYLIDKVSNIKNKNVSLDDLGEFYQYIPNIDLVLCTDMGTEPADFILSSKDKVVFVHVKCGGSASKPQSSAGALCQVGGQALKNIHFLRDYRPLKYGNITTLKEDWPRLNGNKYQNKLNRIRLFNKTYDINHNLDEVLDTINTRKIDPLVSKEIWVVVGNAFSRQHFTSQLKMPLEAVSETIQAYQLLDTWFNQASALNVDLKFFTSE
ncbi:MULTISPECIES: DEAD/DEAH box helicase [Acinetobacter]|uniref:DEAD/DEAH box helicase n=1 Tax=Acinetobacter TaxID=469 RepID=UPI00051B9541|nr:MULTISPECIES: DEAD/DEAH box helicase family protein [Acinetobacter]MCH7381993.1 DEAD/DEAH box helicase family protein [Acinetobacter higginsii]MCJ0828300.1 DEAD/DEAH box helicase family protein [Acinetobacter sp. NIPH1876]